MVDAKLLQNYRALRQLTWTRHRTRGNGHTDYLAPRFTAIGAYRQAIEDGLNGKVRHPSSVPLYFGSWQTEGKFRPRERAFYCDAFPFRHVGRTDECARAAGLRGRSDLVDCQGYYTDDYGDNGTLEGHVLLLPQGKFIPATRHTEQDGVTLYPLDIHEDAISAARSALGIADREAERERDYQRAWRAGVDAAQHQDNANRIRREIRQIIGDLRTSRRAIRPDIDGGTEEDNALLRVCDVVRGKVRSLLSDLYREREKRDELKSDYGTEPAFIETFAEGV